MTEKNQWTMGKQFTYPWSNYPTEPLQIMDDVQLEMLITDILTEDLTFEECSEARELLNNIGIKTQ
jgi:hypothetical protein